MPHWWLALLSRHRKWILRSVAEIPCLEHWQWGGATKSSKSFDHKTYTKDVKIYGELGILHLRKPPYGALYKILRLVILNSTIRWMVLFWTLSTKDNEVYHQTVSCKFAHRPILTKDKKMILWFNDLLSTCLSVFDVQKIPSAPYYIHESSWITI